MDKEVRNTLVRAHQNNINRYCRLLATDLTELERDYARKRIIEETHELEKLLKQPRRRRACSLSLPSNFSALHAG
jgi:hypothetical protein